MAEIAHDRHLGRLAAAEARLGRIFARPKVLAAICVVALAMLGWIYLGLMTAQMIGAGHAASRGPGMGFFDLIAGERLGSVGRQVFDSLCLPTLGGGRHFGALSTEAWGGIDFGLVFLMWCAMALAMMLPSAGPMILTYADIADTAARKGERVVSPLVLAVGYLSIWIGFALGATLLQGVLTRAALIGPGMASASALLSGGIFLAAGLYQFSALKHACLRHCQQPFPFFFTNWSTAPRKIFRLGLRQGLYCLGCCWAMMVVMFAVGVMNVVWMAIIGAIMTLEKVATTTRLSRAVGLTFGAVGLAFIAAVVVEMWPGWGR